MGGHDGIAWREWGEEAFAEAKRENKPVLLDIGAVWCHWCHVMDDGIPGDPVHTGTYSNPDIQKRIADNYIPIKVDNDRRPDINARYNMGGWPTTAFLTPGGDILYGETYVHPSRMISLLDHITDIFRNQRDQLEEQTKDMRRRKAQAEAEEAIPADLDPETAMTVAESIIRNFDPQYGGFGQQPKFPHPDALQFALERYSRTGDERLKTFLEKTMAGMDSGGMYDRYAGGFFRYSTTRDWSIPHYEKMLEDNARLTEAYATASVVLDDERYLNTVRSAHEWLLTAMYDGQTGAFAGSQDADAEEKYYGEPLDVRAALPTPYIDRTVYVNWNALMVSALVRRFQVTGEEAILHTARRTYRFLWDNLSVSDTARGHTFSHYWTDGAAGGSAGLLMDQTAMLGAAIDLYESTGDAEYHEGAILIAKYLRVVLQDDENGGFYDLTPSAESIGELSSPRKDLKENSEAAYLLLKLAQLTETADYRDDALRALRAFTGEYRNVGYFASAYARAVDAALRPPLHIVVVGDAQSEETKALLRIAWKMMRPGKTVELLRASDGGNERGFTAGPNGEARAFVCVGETCLAPASSPDELRQRLYEVLSEG